MRLLCALLILSALAAPARAACDNLAGVYLSDLQTDEVSEALNERLGKNISRFEDRFQTIEPFREAGDGYVVAVGCMAHNCTVDEALLGLDVATCEPFISLLEGGKFTKSFPTLSQWPASLAAERESWKNNR